MAESGAERAAAAAVMDSWARSMSPSRVFKAGIGGPLNEASAHIRDITFHASGNIVATGNEKGQINLYDAHKGERLVTVQNTAYGVSQLRFTHHEHTLLHATPRKKNSVWYLSVRENKYLRRFEGHEKSISSVQVSPAHDEFISASEDGHFKIWDYRANKCSHGGKLNVGGRTVVAYNKNGNIFIVAGSDGIVKFWDRASLGNAPFQDFGPFEEAGDAKIVDVKILETEELLLTLDSGKVMLVDGFDGSVMKIFDSFANQDHQTIPSITGDGNYLVASARSDGRSMVVHDVLDPEDAEPCAVLWGSMQHPGPIRAIAASPTSQLVVSGCDAATVFWLPDDGSSAKLLRDTS